jgi:hypothetical protein
MNKKDLKNLSESYQQILENNLSDMVGIEMDGVDSSIDMNEEPVDPKQHVDDFINDEDVKNMFISNISSIRSHAHKVLKLVESQNKIDAWMADKIAVVANDIKDVCDAMEFGNDVE